MPKTPEEFIRDEIRALTAYPVPDATGMVKLDAMENPYRLPPELRSRIAQLVEGAALNRYPDPGAQRLKARLRAVLASLAALTAPARGGRAGCARAWCSGREGGLHAEDLRNAAGAGARRGAADR